MGESDRHIDYRQQKRALRLGQDKNALFWLMAINIIFFLLLLFVGVVIKFYNSQKGPVTIDNTVEYWFSLPGSLTRLSERPWTLLTFMFTEVSLFALLGNMLWLWAFGTILQLYTTNKIIIPVYIYGSLLGAMVFFIFVYAAPFLRPANIQPLLWGANCGIMAVAVATTTLAPGYRFFQQLNGGIPIWILTGVYVLIDFVGVMQMGSVVAAAHLGGALAGFLFIYFLRKGKDGSVWMNNWYDRFIHLFDPNKKPVANTTREKVFYNTGGRHPFTKVHNLTQQRVDEILDKINQKGYGMLTDEEKNILKRASEDDAL